MTHHEDNGVYGTQENLYIHELRRTSRKRLCIGA